MDASEFFTIIGFILLSLAQKRAECTTSMKIMDE